MGWLDALLGRTRLPKARPEGLFALTTAQLALKTELGWEPAGPRGPLPQTHHHRRLPPAG